jgi:hypothetical protein
MEKAQEEMPARPRPGGGRPRAHPDDVRERFVQQMPLQWVGECSAASALLLAGADPAAGDALGRAPLLFGQGSSRIGRQVRLNERKAVFHRHLSEYFNKTLHCG